MPTFLLLILVLLIRQSRSIPCIALDPSPPFPVSLVNGTAPLTLNVSLCPNASITATTRPPRLAPSISVQSLPNSPDGCQLLRTTLVFQSDIGSGELVFATPNCTLSVPVVVAGVVAKHLPSREPATAIGADPILIPAPRRNSVRAVFAVKAVLPTGQTLRRRNAAKALEVSLSPPISSVSAFLGVANSSGNLQILSTDDTSSDAPRPQIIQTVKLSLAESGISAGFRIIHAPLVVTVGAVKAPKRLSPTGGDRITFVVRHAAADKRRLVIGNVTVTELEYVSDGDRYLSSFISPPLPWGRHESRMELITNGNVTIAEDNSGHVFIVAAQPILTTILPAVARPGTDGFVILSGIFDGSVVVFVDGEPAPSGSILHRASGQIILRLPRVSPTFNGTVPVLLYSARGRESNELTFKFDPDAIYVDAVVAHASTDSPNGRFVIPLMCNHSEAPVVFARADTPQDVYEPPSFNFSVRTSASELNFQDLSSGPSGMVSLDPDYFGEDPELENDFVTIRIYVSQEERSGEVLVFISRRLRPDVVGVTVVPPFEVQRRTDHAILEAQVTPLGRCPNATKFETQTVWSINKKAIVSTRPEDANGPGRVASALAAGLGRTLVVPDQTDEFSYVASVDVTDRSTGRIIATGTSGNRGRLRALEPFLRTFLNGGLGSITLRTGIETFEIHSSLYELDDSISLQQVQYEWGCKPLSLETSRCPEALFPVSISKSRKATRFNVTTIGVLEKLAVEYFLTVLLGTRQVGHARLRLSVNPSEKDVFPSSKISASASPPDVLSDGSIRFSCYQHILLAILDSRVNDTYSFAIFREGNDTNILEASPDHLLVAHNGYWSPRERKNILFGILANRLGAGNYTLYGTRDGKAEPGRGASWVIQIQQCPVLVPYKLPFSSGVAGLTTFFAGATSVPPSRNLFFFELTRQEEGETAPNTNPPNSTAYLPACSGSQICPFVVSAAGRYFIRIDMYDPSGTRRLSSERLETPITVLTPNATETDSNSTDTESSTRAMTVDAALLHEDDGAFIHGVLQLSPQEQLEEPIVEETINGLQKLGSSPALVPVRGSLILVACSHLMKFEQIHRDFERVDKIRLVVETTITRSISNSGPATALRDPGASFYSALLQEASNLDGSLRGENTTVTSTMSEKSRRSAATHLPLILAVGRECGFLDQLVVNYPAHTRFNVSLGTPLVSKFDDCRIAVNCFSGQVSRLLPEPFSLERCSETESDRRIFATPQVMVSVEQHDLTTVSQTEILSGPTMQTRVMRLKQVRDSILLEDDRQSKAACYKTRVSVYVPTRDLAEDLVLSARGRVNISCEPDVLQVSSLEIEESDSAIVKSEARTFRIDSDGRVSTFLEASPPFSARMRVNGTRLRQCIIVTRLEGNGSSTTTAIIFSVLAAVTMVLVTATLLFICLRSRRRRDSFSVPESLAPWDSGEMSPPHTRSTLSSYHHFMSGELSPVRNRWEGQYRPVQHRVVVKDWEESGTEGDERRIEERRKSQGVSKSEVDELEGFSGSGMTSLLTATDSYTTSSGDVSSFGVSNRMGEQGDLKKKALVRFNIPVVVAQSKT